MILSLYYIIFATPLQMKAYKNDEQTTYYPGFRRGSNIERTF